jgi:hypothetical protein
MVEGEALRVGSRRDVYKGLAIKTRGGLVSKDLIKNARGKIVSLKKSKMAHKAKFNPLMKQKLLIPEGSGVFGVHQMLHKKKQTRKNGR